MNTLGLQFVLVTSELTLNWNFNLNVIWWPYILQTLSFAAFVAVITGPPNALVLFARWRLWTLVGVVCRRL